MRVRWQLLNDYPKPGIGMGLVIQILCVAVMVVGFAMVAIAQMAKLLGYG